MSSQENKTQHLDLCKYLYRFKKEKENVTASDSKDVDYRKRD